MSTDAPALRLWTDDFDTWVAADRDDLRAALREFYGDDTGEDREWREVPPGTWQHVHWNGEPEGFDAATVTPEQHPDNADWTHVVTATAAAWAAWHGRGFLCSTEW